MSSKKLPKKILVTGGAGYIGSHVAHMLTDQGCEVHVLDNLSTGHRWAIPKTAKFHELDMGSRAEVEKILKENGIKSVIHFAANIEVPISVADPLKFYRNNTSKALEFIQACINSGVEHFIFSSTAAVYGMPEKQPITEQTPAEPINPYGRTKLFTEHILKDVEASPENKGKFKYVILRYFNVAGARADGSIGQATPNATHLIKVACEVLTGQRDKITVFGTDYKTPDGTCVRDYIHVDDLANAHLMAMEYLNAGGKPDTFNCGYGHGYSVKQVLDTMESISGKKLNVLMGDRRAGDPPAVVADSTKIRKALGWTPKNDSLEFICKTAYAWEQTILSRNKK